VALELQTTSVEESFKTKSPDLATLERCLKGPASMCSCQSARWAMKCRKGTPVCLVPHHRLPNKVVLRRCMACPRSCFLCPLRGGASSVLHFISAAPPNCSGGSGRFPRSAYHKDMEAHSDHNPLSAGDARASTCSFFIVEFRMKVVKFVKMKPHEVALLELLSFYALHCLLASHQGSQSGVIPNSRVSMLVVLLST
jgi:hypothetical protein